MLVHTSNSVWLAKGNLHIQRINLLLEGIFCPVILICIFISDGFSDSQAGMSVFDI